MTISEERKKRVIDLYYNQGKTTRDIAEIERMSIRDISAILKEEEARRQRHNQQQEQGELSAKAYELFSKGKTPVEVAIALNLREPEVSIMYREYWKLKRQYKLNLIYEELGDDGTEYFVKLIKLAKKEDVSVEQLLKLADLADEGNPFGLSQLEKRQEWLIGNIHELDLQLEKAKNHLHTLSNQIANARKLLSDSTISCKDKRQELEKITSKISRLLAL